MRNRKYLLAMHAVKTGKKPISVALLLWLFAGCFMALSANAAANADLARLVTLKATVVVKNNGAIPLDSYTHRLTIPANDHAQQRLLRIEYPYEDSYTLRPHDNGVDNYMKFKWDIPPRSRLVREITFHLRISPFDYERTPIPKSALAGSGFLAPSEYVESNSREILAIAQQIKSAYPTPSGQLLAAFQYPQKTLRYRTIENKGALFALHNGIGDCTEYAAVFIAIARALGVPARMTSEFNFAETRSFAEPNHHAAEAYIDGAWIPIDPNLALQPSLGYGFGYGSTTKVVLRRGDSWTWSNSFHSTARAYRDRFVEVDIHWSIDIAN